MCVTFGVGVVIDIRRKMGAKTVESCGTHTQGGIRAVLYEFGCRHIRTRALVRSCVCTCVRVYKCLRRGGGGGAYCCLLFYVYG